MAGFDDIKVTEELLAHYTDAPYAVLTDCCTHALELAFRYDQVKECSFTPHTYLSVPMLMHKLGVNYEYIKFDYSWIGEYQFLGTRIFDSARKLTRGMFIPGKIQCLSFGIHKPLSTGRGGAILTDDKDAYEWFIRARSDGRDLSISPWEDQRTFQVGYHYRPTIEEANAIRVKLETYAMTLGVSQQVAYPDLRKINIIG